MIATLAVQALLALAVLCARPPAAVAALRVRLLVQVGLCCVCLLAAAWSGRTTAPALVCVGGVVLELVVLLARWKRWPETAEPPTEGLWSVRASWPLVAGVLVAWLAFRLAPGVQVAAAAGVGIGAQAAMQSGTTLGIVLCAMVGLLAARTTRSRQASLLLAGHGVLVFAGTVPGPGWPGVAMAILLQGAALAAFCARPVWSGEAETGGVAENRDRVDLLRGGIGMQDR